MTNRPRVLQSPGRYPRRSRPRPVGAPAASVAAADIEAAKRIVLHVRSSLELLASDLRDLYVALDQRPGQVSELAAKLLDDPDSWRY
jgi:hypothetical protein